MTRCPAWASLSSRPPPAVSSAPTNPPVRSALRGVSVAVGGPAFRRAAESRPPQSDSNRTSTAAAPKAPTDPTTKTRRRRWGTPKPRASSTRQHTVRLWPWQTPPDRHPPSGTSGWNPESSARTLAKSYPPPLDKAPSTFSQQTQSGATSSATRTNSKNRRDRSPSKPARPPATERSWQGVPPMTRSTSVTPSAASRSRVTSAMSW